MRNTVLMKLMNPVSITSLSFVSFFAFVCFSEGKSACIYACVRVCACMRVCVCCGVCVVGWEGDACMCMYYITTVINS